MITRRGLAAGAALLAARPGLAQGGYPERPIRLVVPFPAGGGVDITARLLGEPFRAALGQPVVVENRSGASGMIGAQAVATAAPDGHTLLLAGAGEIAINPHLFRGRMSYDPARQFAPVSLVVKVPIVLFASPGVGITSVAELIARAKAQPETLTYSSSGIGNPQHLAGEFFNHLAGTRITHIPYRGAAPAVTDVATGRVSVGFNGLGAALPLIRDGKLRPLAVTSRERLPQLPEVPALAEYPPLAAYELLNWFGLFAPAATPAPIVTRLAQVTASALADPTVAARLDEQGFIPAAMPRETFAAFVAADAEKFGRIVEDAQITPDS